LNKIYYMDCLEGMKQMDDDSVDLVLTDQPYFLISKSGSGFMGKRWDSLNRDKTHDILCKSNEFVKSVERFFMLLKVERNGEEVNFVQENASIKDKNNQIKLKSNVMSVENGLNDMHIVHRYLYFLFSNLYKHSSDCAGSGSIHTICKKCGTSIANMFYD
ncbi:unnamed protein product, partial [marine sediment metagenome]